MGNGDKTIQCHSWQEDGMLAFRKTHINFEGTKANVNDISKEWVCQQYFISKVYYDMFA